MKLATISNGTPDGQLVIVSDDNLHFREAPVPFVTLQAALEHWVAAEPILRAMAQTFSDDVAHHVTSAPFGAPFAAPLPRAWQWLDGSAYRSHGALMEELYKTAPPPLETPLMYQGLSHQFYGATDDIPLPSEQDGIDFEGEFGVITDFVPMATSAEQAMSHIRLVVQINDWSLRALALPEMKTGFGWVGAKPACSVAPFAITPDALGEYWRDGRVQLPLEVRWNDNLFGKPEGAQMGFGFHELIAHAARTRSLCAGTIIGSGTVSNPDYRTVGSTCIAERRAIEMLDEGAARTDYMRFGDRVRMEALTPDGSSPFGAIDQRVVSGLVR
jgi:fumarylacetoacetate (FAA) hydrolase